MNVEIFFHFLSNSLAYAAFLIAAYFGLTFSEQPATQVYQYATVMDQSSSLALKAVFVDPLSIVLLFGFLFIGLSSYLAINYTISVWISDFRVDYFDNLRAYPSVATAILFLWLVIANLVFEVMFVVRSWLLWSKWDRMLATLTGDATKTSENDKSKRCSIRLSEKNEEPRDLEKKFINGQVLYSKWFKMRGSILCKIYEYLEVSTSDKSLNCSNQVHLMYRFGAFSRFVYVGKEDETRIRCVEEGGRCSIRISEPDGDDVGDTYKWHGIISDIEYAVQERSDTSSISVSMKSGSNPLFVPSIGVSLKLFSVKFPLYFPLRSKTRSGGRYYWYCD